MSKELAMHRAAGEGALGIFLKQLTGTHVFSNPHDAVAMVLFHGISQPEMVMMSNLEKLSSNDL